MKGPKKLLKNQSGMSLIEVSVAVFLFAVFVTAYMAGQGGNLNDSMTFKGELLLKDIAEMKMNEELINPSETFKVTGGKVKIEPPKDAEFKDIEEYPGYKVAVQYFKITIPDLNQLTGQEENENNPDQNQAIQKRIFDNFKKNMEQLVWQIMVTVKHQDSGAQYDLSAWYYNEGGQLQFDIQ